MNAMTNFPLHDRRPVSIRPVSKAGWHQMSGDRRCTHASAMANYLYITRGVGADARGQIDYSHRDDLVAHGLELPANHPCWAEEPGRIWRELDESTAHLADDEVRAWHVVVTLPANEGPDTWIAMTRDYALRSIAAHGPAVAWSIHAKTHAGGQATVPPHAHLLVTTRVWRHEARQGQTVPGWCGPAARARLHANWLAKLPQSMRAAAVSPYSAGQYVPARLDFSALGHLMAAQTSKIEPS